ncbi:MAG TPA: cache domain-containing protein [Burkholderiaceae bacterium]|nr:cache domain-containing protein [Burkholderiaceae bacterium]
MSVRSMPPLLAFLACVLVSALCAWIGHARLIEAADDELALAARSAAARVETELRGRLRALESVAALEAQAPSAADVAGHRRAALAILARLYPELAWAGFTDDSGRVLAAHRGLLEGVDVSARPWWRAARGGPYLGGAREAVLLADALRAIAIGTDPPRLLDVAVPLRDAAGVPKGVLGVHLDAEWAARLREALQGTLARLDDVEVLLVQPDGRPVSGRPSSGPAVELPGRGGEMGRTAMVDGRERAVAAAAVDGDVVVSRLGWTIVVARDPGRHSARASAYATGVLAAGLAVGALAALGTRLALRRRPAP